MKKKNVVTMMMCLGLVAFLTAPGHAHQPIDGSEDCPERKYFDFPNLGDPGSACYDDIADFTLPPGEGGNPAEEDLPFMSTEPCFVIWPDNPLVPMPTWDVGLRVIWDYHPDEGWFPDLNPLMMEVIDNFPTDLPDTFDFCGWMDQLYCALAPVADEFGIDELLIYGDLLRCGLADINGPIDECFDLPVTGNGIPDQYELAVIAAVLNDPGHDLHLNALNALQHNIDELAALTKLALSDVVLKETEGTDIRGVIYTLAPWMLPSLNGILSAFAILGDDGTLGALDEVVGLLADIGIDPEGGIDDLIITVPALGCDGDTSGNGYLNREIYEWFIQQNELMTADEYVALVLDPAETPPAKVTVGGGGSYDLGADITLTANVALEPGAQAVGYQWMEWIVVEQAPADPEDPDGDQCDVYGWAPIPDETGSELALGPINEEFVGKYAVEVEMSSDKDGSGVILASTEIVVAEQPELPAGSATGLALLAGVCALAGALGIRRRTKK